MQTYNKNRKIVTKHESKRPINGDIEECEAKEERNGAPLPDFAPGCVRARKCRRARAVIW